MRFGMRNEKQPLKIGQTRTGGAGQETRFKILQFREDEQGVIVYVQVKILEAAYKYRKSVGQVHWLRYEDLWNSIKS